MTLFLLTVSEIEDSIAFQELVWNLQAQFMVSSGIWSI